MICIWVTIKANKKSLKSLCLNSELANKPFNAFNDAKTIISSVT